MIVFDLECRTAQHRFEGWFGSSQDFAAQQARGLVTCPQCGCGDVIKAPMAPALGRKGNQIEAAPAPVQRQGVTGGAMPVQAAEMMRQLAELQAQALKQSRWVGESFAEVSRQIHYGEREAEQVHGQATPDEAQSLLEEGVAVMPLPFPVAPPDDLN